MQQQFNTPNRSRRRIQQRTSISPGALTTAISVGAVLLLIAAVFVGEWLRVPGITMDSTLVVISPNGDRDHDIATLTYALSEDARVTIEVQGSGSGLVRTLLQDENQPAGQHFITWDGLNQAGSVVSDGDYRLVVQAAGSLRAANRGALIQVDTRPPQLQLVNLPDNQRVGTPLLQITGISDPDALVWVNGQAQPLPLDNQGRFTYDRTLVEGANLIEIRAVDAAGNTTRLTRQVVLVTAPPDIVVTRPLEDEWTNQAVLRVIGQAPPGIAITINGQVVNLAQDGAFNHELLLFEGDNTLQILATDDVGNITSLSRSVHLKTIPPEVQLSVPEGARVTASEILLTGRTEPGATVMINSRVVPLSPLGDFQSNLLLVEGENYVRVQVIDRAGNSTNLARRILYGTPQASSGLDRMLQNLGSLPPVTIPAILLTSLVIAVLLLRQNQVGLLLSIDQNQLMPGQPTEDRLLHLTLDINKTARVSLEVVDQSGNTLATLLRNRRRTPRAYSFQWNGYDDYGNPVPPGEYTIQAIAGTSPAQAVSAVQVTILENPSLVYLRQPASERARSLRQRQE